MWDFAGRGHYRGRPHGGEGLAHRPLRTFSDVLYAVTPKLRRHWQIATSSACKYIPRINITLSLLFA